MFEKLFGPIFGWEIITTARRKRYYFFRFLFGVACLFVLWATFESSIAMSRYAHQSTANLGPYFSQQFFDQYLFVALFVVLAMTPAYLATAVIIEREQKTLDYLLASDVRSYEIIIGKLLGRVSNVISLLLASIPILAATFFYGGVSLDDVLFLSAVLLSTIASVAGISLLVSVYSKKTREALSGAYAMTLLYLISPAIVLLILLPFCPSNLSVVGYFEKTFQMSFERFFAYVNPFAIVLQLAQIRFRGAGLVTSQLLASYAAVQFSIAALCIALATWRLRMAHDRLTGGTSLIKGMKSRPWIRRGFVGPVGDNGLLWKEWYFSNSMGNVIFQSIAVLAILFFIYFPYHDAIFHWIERRGEENELTPDALLTFFRVVTPLMFVLAYLNAALKAGAAIGGEKDRDCWISLISTSLTAKEIIIWKWFGTLKPILWLWIFFLPSWLLAAWFGGLHVLSIFMVAITTLIFGAFFCAIGVANSLRRKTTTGAIGATVFAGLLTCGLAQSLIAIVALAFISAFGSSYEPWRSYDTPMLTVSNPIMGIVYSCFSDLRERPSYGTSPASLRGYVPFIVLGFAIATAISLKRSIRAFEKLTGRTEQSLPIPRN